MMQFSWQMVSTGHSAQNLTKFHISFNLENFRNQTKGLDRWDLVFLLTKV